jgi:hypothetical protein
MARVAAFGCLAIAACGVLSAQQPPTGGEDQSVGYLNIPCEAGFNLIANPLDAGDNSVRALFADVPAGSVLYKYGADGFTVNVRDENNWSDPEQTLAPGEGAFLFVPRPTTITIAGAILQGTLVNHLPAGFSLRASMIPKGGALDTDLGFPVADGDIIYRYTPSQGYSVHVFEEGAWNDPPVLRPGESVFVWKAAETDWIEHLTLPEP